MIYSEYSMNSTEWTTVNLVNIYLPTYIRSIQILDDDDIFLLVFTLNHTLSICVSSILRPAYNSYNPLSMPLHRKKPRTHT